MDWSVRSMTCRHGACCSSALNCPWWHSVEEVKIFKDELDLQRRKLAVRCGFCARGECQFGVDCRRSKRVAEFVAMGSKSVAPTDLGSDVCAGAGGVTKDAAAAKADSNDWETENSAEVRFEGSNASVAHWKPFVFGRRKVGVVKKPSVVEGAGGVGDAGAFGALASLEKDEVEEPVNITFLLPKPRGNEKKQMKKEKAAVNAVEQTAGDDAEMDLEAAETAAKAAVVAAAGVRKVVRFEDSERAVVKVGRLPVRREVAEEAAVSVAEVKGDAAKTAAEKATDSTAEMKRDAAKTAVELKAERAEADTAAETKRELEWEKREAEMEIVRQRQKLWRERQKLAAPGSNSE